MTVSASKPKTKLGVEKFGSPLFAALEVLREAKLRAKRNGDAIDGPQVLQAWIRVYDLCDQITEVE